MVAAGAEIRRTKLTESFDLEAWHAEHGEAVPLFALTPEGRLRMFQNEPPIEPGPGWTVFALRPPKSAEVAAEADGAGAASA